MRAWAVTLKFNNKVSCCKDYLAKLKNFKYGDLMDYAFEFDSDDRLHVHALFFSYRKLYYMSAIERFFHINVQELKTQDNIDYWQAYIHKNCCYAGEECSQVVQKTDMLNDARHECLFQDIVKV